MINRAVLALGLIFALTTASHPAAAFDTPVTSSEEAAEIEGLNTAPEEEYQHFREERRIRMRNNALLEPLRHPDPPATPKKDQQPLLEEQELDSPAIPVPDPRRDYYTPERERQRLQAPPASVEPRRDGPSDPRLRPRQVGPRRFAPTPDLNGRGSPFDFERYQPEENRERQRR
jgi:hypothetical protein